MNLFYAMTLPKQFFQMHRFKKSGIDNDANRRTTETMGNPKCLLELLLRVITVSLETGKIVASLPQLEID